MEFMCFACFAVPWPDGADGHGDGVVPAGIDSSASAVRSLHCARCGTGLRLGGPFARWYQDSSASAAP